MRPAGEGAAVFRAARRAAQGHGVRRCEVHSREENTDAREAGQMTDRTQHVIKSHGALLTLAQRWRQALCRIGRERVRPTSVQVALTSVKAGLRLPGS